MRKVYYVLLGIVCFLGLTVLIGQMHEQQQDPARRATPASERRAKVLDDCRYLVSTLDKRSPSEISASDRRLQAACTAQLALPDQEIIRLEK